MKIGIYTDSHYSSAEITCGCRYNNQSARSRRHMRALKERDADTYIFVHQNIDPAVKANHRLFNADKILDMIDESKVVRAVFQEHYHPGCRSQYNGIQYITLPAMCESENAFWVYEI